MILSHNSRVVIEASKITLPALSWAIANSAYSSVGWMIDPGVPV